MKKIFIGFLSVLTIYHFLYSSMFSVYAIDVVENTVTDQMEFEMPEIIETYGIYENSRSALALGQLALGGITITTAPLTLGAYLLGAVALGVGTYFMLQGHSSLSLDNIYTKLPNNITSSDFEVNSDGSVSFNPSSANSNFYKISANETFFRPEKMDFNADKVFQTSGDNKIQFINDVPNLTTSWFSGYRSSGRGYYITFGLNSPGYKFVMPLYNSSGNFLKYAVIQGVASSSIYIYQNGAFDFPNAFTTFINSTGGSTNAYYNGYGKGGEKKSSNYHFQYSGVNSFHALLSSMGAMWMTDAEYNTWLNTLKTTSQISSYSVPLEQMALANPDLTYSMENNAWYNAEGEKVDNDELVTPLPNTMTNQGLTFDDVTQNAIDNAIKGETDIPDSDTGTGEGGGVGGTGWLSSVLNAIMSLPSLIANAFASLFEMVVNAIKSIPSAIGLFIDNVIIAVQSIPNALSGMFDNVVGAVQSIPNALSGVLGGISTGINNTWEWCQGLPNLLGELLNALGSAIVNGLTSALSGILSAIQTLVDFFTGILDFVMSLVIPSNGFFTSELSKLKDVFNSKFPFFSQINDILNAFKFDINSPLPEFKITMPIKYGGQTYSVINFAHFVSYRQYILNFVRLFTWIPFLMRIYKKSMYMATGK